MKIMILLKRFIEIPKLMPKKYKNKLFAIEVEKQN